ncbi:MAG: chemotaxis protein CheW [Blastocatellia bacterium]|nr:chemotaxis protein CheW [Blastocatellia bacterium]
MALDEYGELPELVAEPAPEFELPACVTTPASEAELPAGFSASLPVTPEAFELPPEMLPQPEPAEPVPTAAEPVNPLAVLMGTMQQELETHPRAMPVTPTRTAPEAGTVRKYLGFVLHGRRFAVPMTGIAEIGLVPPVTMLPGAPQWLRGVANLRGDIVSVVDLQVFMGGEPTLTDAFHNRLLVAQSARRDLAAGLVVERVTGLVKCAEHEIEAVAFDTTDAISPFVQGVCDHATGLLTVLDLNRLLTAPEFRCFEPF